MTTHESRGIDNPQALGPLDPQVRVQCAFLTVTHRNRANRMVDRIALVADEGINLVVRLCLGEIAELADDVVRKTGRRDILARSLHGFAHDRDVERRREESGIDYGRVEGVRGCEGDVSTCIYQGIQTMTRHGYEHSRAYVRRAR